MSGWSGKIIAESVNSRHDAVAHSAAVDVSASVVSNAAETLPATVWPIAQVFTAVLCLFAELEVQQSTTSSADDDDVVLDEELASMMPEASQSLPAAAAPGAAPEASASATALDAIVAEATSLKSSSGRFGSGLLKTLGGLTAGSFASGITSKLGAMFNMSSVGCLSGTAANQLLCHHISAHLLHPSMRNSAL